MLTNRKVVEICGKEVELKVWKDYIVGRGYHAVIRSVRTPAVIVAHTYHLTRSGALNALEDKLVTEIAPRVLMNRLKPSR